MNDLAAPTASALEHLRFPGEDATSRHAPEGRGAFQPKLAYR